MNEKITSPPTDPAEAAAWVEFYYQQGWSDGLPLVPPTEESVRAMLEAGQVKAEESLGTIAERNVTIPAEKVAINAVMAGCLPEYFPVVLAAVRGLCRPEFHYHNPATSTGGSALTLIVNGPIGPALGINATHNAFGPGFRPNATIGRALRLVMLNVLNTRPGLLDKATLGSPGKYAFCFAENEENHPWQPLHVERGFRPEDSTVTLYASNTLMGVYNQLASTPEPLLLEFADAVCNLASPNVYGFNQSLLVLAGEHAEIIKHSGWSRRQVQEWVIQQARRSVADFKRAGRLAGEIRPEDETTWRYVMRDPDDVLIVCAGAQGGSWSACLPGWGNKWTRSVTELVRV